LELGAGFNPEYSGKENIYLNGLMMGYTREEIDEKMDDIIKFADIGDFIEQPVKIYSSGMFARLAFAVSINVEPDILIVDEALAVGDVRFQTKCIDKMKELKKQGTTILFVSHATEQVKRFCNQAIWLKDGVVHAAGDSSEIADMYEDFMKYNTEH
ncbi:ABC transporter ATP-binding protein, partial [Clostridium perfringens]